MHGSLVTRVTTICVGVDRESYGVADFILARWRELQIFNPSGGYCVEIPWNLHSERELTPAEVTAIIMRGKPKEKKRKQGSSRRR